ncbi:ERI1 exoribonuclease 2 [Cheilinus undulatus]|uniref:ERI1 exoribonuclease 2 n=1 Tax=Cheilinus undulatus TaxID=241271 RepID=UPI001BD2DE73|nr:ERI1 exoribonuclease 2 [Cheilinus undulatus]
MSTKKLAKELGLLRQRSQSSHGSKKSPLSNQTFSYLIVIDFESTCWKEKNNYGQEIIEFPAVLLNTSTGEVESEFHTYVQPQEHPILSDFCTELTGITQMQVEAGVPLQICLSRFSRWLQNLQAEKGVVFPKKQQKSSATSPSQKLCAFVTWSDWDLGVCLQYESKRKQLYKPDVLNSWIDLRSTYRLFYDRKPKGLNGALQDLGIQFSGREHSGLDDARNTAHLAARMMRDGCVMKITRSLVKNPVVEKPVYGSTTADSKKEKNNSNRGGNIHPSSCKMPSKLSHMKPCVEKATKDLDTKEDSTSVCQSLISPKTLLHGMTKPARGHSRRSVAAEAVTNISSSVLINPPNNNINNSSLVLCSTTVACLSNLPQINQHSNTAAVSGLEEEEGAELFVEGEDRYGSYDDVVLEGDESICETEGVLDAEYVAGFDSEYHPWEEPGNSHSAQSQDDKGETVSVDNNFKMPRMPNESSKTFFCANNMSSRVVVGKGGRQDSTISKSSFEFLVPKPPDSKSSQLKTGFKTSLQVQEKSNKNNTNSKLNTPFPFRRQFFIPEKTSTPHTSFAKPKPVSTKPTKHTETPKSSFAIYTDPEKPSCSSMCGSFSAPKSVLSSLSTNTPSSRMNQSIISGTFKGQKITSPLCACGRRAKRQVVSNGGPNHGRGFYCCPVRRSGSGGSFKKGCEFFKWESAVMKSSSVSSPAVRSSVSLCRMNSTLNCGPSHRSMIRKSY